jgi:hypothetical protein
MIFPDVSCFVVSGSAPFNAMGQRVLLNMDNQEDIVSFEDDERSAMRDDDMAYLDVMQPDGMTLH